MARKSSIVRNSRYLKKEDCDPPITVTIREVRDENVAGDGQAPEQKQVVYFRNMEKGMVLNWTNAQLIDRIAGGDDLDTDWPGTVIVLAHDPTISFAGKLVGGIRVQMPARPVKKPTKRQAVPADPEPFDDQVPFGDDDEDAAA